jgi:hypothetical protein
MKQRPDWSKVKKGLGYGAAAGVVGGAVAAPAIANMDDPSSVLRTIGGGALLGAGLGGARGAIAPLRQAITRAGAARRTAL